MSEFVLIYSNECPHSKECIDMIKKSNMNRKVKLVDIRNLSSIPKGITSVPTMINTRNNELIIGDTLFKWLQNETMGNRKVIIRKSENNLKDFGRNL